MAGDVLLTQLYAVAPLGPHRTHLVFLVWFDDAELRFFGFWKKCWEDTVAVLLAQSVNGKSIFKSLGSGAADRDVFWSHVRSSGPG